MTGKSLHCLRKKDLSIEKRRQIFFTNPVTFPSAQICYCFFLKYQSVYRASVKYFFIL
jgi:hypothetical protein